MTQQHLQPLLSGFLWGLNSSLLLIVATLIASRDRTVMTAAPAVTNTDPVGTAEQRDLRDPQR